MNGVSGIKGTVPVQAGEDDYNIEILQEIEGLEQESFWYQGRRDLIVWAVAHYFHAAGILLEIGSGTGFILAAINKARPSLKVVAGDIYLKGLRSVEKRVAGVSVCQLDVRNLPFHSTLSIIGAFDVLEHIQADEAALQQMFQAVHPSGGMILTVPQHPWLWSAMDAMSQHKRRYTRQELVHKVKNAGFSIVRSTSFGALVFPLKLLEVVVRAVKKKLRLQDEQVHLARLPKLINQGIYGLMGIENFLIKHNVSFPFGSSLLLVAKKSPHHASEP